MQGRNIAAMYLASVMVAYLAFVQSAAAKDASKTCANAEPLPSALSGWDGSGTLTAANDEKGAAGAALVPGHAVKARLSRTSGVHYVVPPEKPGKPESYGGMLAFEAPEDGTYQVSLGTAAWVDVIRDGRAITSTAHGHGPECSGLHKMVSFQLDNGLHILQIAANETPDISVMVTQIP